MDVRCLRRACEAGPAHGPRDAVAVLAQRARKPALASDQFWRHLAEAGKSCAVSGRIVLYCARGERGQRGRYHQRDGGQSKLLLHIPLHRFPLRLTISVAASIPAASYTTLGVVTASGSSRSQPTALGRSE